MGSATPISIVSCSACCTVFPLGATNSSPASTPAPEAQIISNVLPRSSKAAKTPAVNWVMGAPGLNTRAAIGLLAMVSSLLGAELTVDRLEEKSLVVNNHEMRGCPHIEPEGNPGVATPCHGVLMGDIGVVQPGETGNGHVPWRLWRAAITKSHREVGSNGWQQQTTQLGVG